MGAGCSDAPGLFFVCITWKEGLRRFILRSAGFRLLVEGTATACAGSCKRARSLCLAYARVCGIIAFRLVFGKVFNIMSALFVHQLLTLPQIIDSRGGLF